jgi:membrane-associated phospholipid phosphatase
MDRRSLTRAGLNAGAAAMIAAISSTPAGAAADRRTFDLLNSERGPLADAVFGGVTELGSIAASASAAFVLAVGGRRRAAVEALGAAGAAWLVGQALKLVLRRPRPYDAGGSRRLIGRPRGTSWPSIHPAVLLAFMTVASSRLGLGPAARRALACIPVAIAASRVYVGVHYPSDVAGGLALGRAVGDAWLAPCPNAR